MEITAVHREDNKVVALESSLQALTVADLVRIRRGYFAHDTTIHRKDHLAHTIAAKVHDRRSRQRPLSAAPRVSRSCVEVSVLPPTASVVIVPPGVQQQEGAAAPAETPLFMRSTGVSRASWFDACVRDLGVAREPPQKVIDLRRSFLGDPERHLDSYVRLGAAAARHLMQKYKGQLCRKCPGDGGAQRPRSASGARPPAGGSRGGRKSLADARLDVQKAALAEWKIRRFVEQGPGYLYHVWAKLKKEQLDLEYNGFYVIPNRETAEAAVATRKAYESRLAALDRLRQCERSPPKKKKAKGDRGENGGDGDNSGSDVGDDHDEHGAAAAEDEPSGAPYASVLVTPYNTLEIKLYLSEEQATQLAANRQEGDPISSSGFLMRVEAACIRADKESGVDTWIGIAGRLMNTLIFFIRDSEGGLDSFVVDGMLFEKRYVKRGGSDTDPFLCSTCGNPRLSNNFVYVLPRSEEFRRGKYFCTICQKKTTHVIASRRFKKPLPTWSSSISRLPLESTTLSEPPFKGLKPSMYM